MPWPEVGRPDHIAACAVFLASDDSEFVTGDTMIVDGGMTAVSPGLTMHDTPVGVPPGFVGVNRGTTGEGSLVRRRPGT
jgi:hypothetical protein